MELEQMPLEHNITNFKVQKTTVFLLFFVLLLLSKSLNSLGQGLHKIEAPVYKNNKRFTDMVLDNAKLMRAKQNDCFIFHYKFKISEKGTIDTIRIDGSSDVELRNFFRQKIKDSERNWTPCKINDIPTESKWFCITIYLGSKRYTDSVEEEIKLNFTYPILELAYELEKKRFDSESGFYKYHYLETTDMYLLAPLFFQGAVR